MKRYTIVLGALAALSLAAPAPEITLKQPSRPQPHLRRTRLPARPLQPPPAARAGAGRDTRRSGEWPRRRRGRACASP